MLLVFQIIAFGLVAVNSPCYSSILVVGSQRVNHDKVTFFSARTSPNFSHFPRQLKRALPFDFALERDPKNIFYYLLFLLFDRHEYICMGFSGL